MTIDPHSDIRSFNKRSVALKLLCVSYGGGHVAMLVPVVKLALQRGHEVVFLGLTTARRSLDLQGIPSIGFADLLSDADGAARAYGRELAAGLPADGPVPLAESQAYLGLSFADLVAEWGEKEARARYAAQGRQAFLPVRTLRRAMEAIRPDLVVATNSPRAERAAIMAAGQLGIPSVCAVDSFALREVEWIGVPGFATHVCVLNDAVKTTISQHGRARDEIIVTGNPAFDSLFTEEMVQAGAALRAQSGWASDARLTILFASQDEPTHHTFTGLGGGDPSLPDRMEQVLRNFVAHTPDYRLVIRYHPNQKRAFIPGLNVEFSPSSQPLPPLLHAVDGVVATTSTVAIEASLIGKPVLTVDSSIFTVDAPFSAMGISTGVMTPEEMPAALSAMAATLRPGEARLAPAGGNAAERVMAVIESLLPAAALRATSSGS